MEILTFLKGKKTYILVACGLAVAALHVLGVIDETTANTALTVLGLGSVATLRAGIVNALALAKGETAEAAVVEPPAAPPAA